MMNFNFKNKKAVSPLIATVLLIAFAVALGAVVMNWGRGYVEDTQNFARERSDAEVTCTTDINLDVVTIDLVQQVCINTSMTPDEVSIILENTANRDIESLDVRVIGTTSRVPYFAVLNDEDGANTTSDITAGNARLFTFQHNDTTFGSIDQIAITPVIKLAGKDVACTGNQLKIIGIKDCSEIW